MPQASRAVRVDLELLKLKLRGSRLALTGSFFYHHPRSHPFDLITVREHV